MGTADFTIDLLSNTEGIPLIVPWLQKPAVASSCGDDFGAMMEYAANPMEFNIILLELYNSLPIFLHNPLSIRTLPRSPMLKEALLAHAMCFMGYMLDQGLKSSSSMCPLFVVTVTHTNRYMMLVNALSYKLKVNRDFHGGEMGFWTECIMQILVQ